MGRRTPASHVVTRQRLALVALLAGALTSCADEPPTEATGDSLRLAQTTTNDGVITVTVKNKGRGIDGLVVTAVNNVLGPFTEPNGGGIHTIDLTADGGGVEFSGLAVPGDYCVHVRPLTDLNTAVGDNLVVPSETPPVPAGTDGGAISETAGKSVPFTEDNYRENCINDPPFGLRANKKTASATLKLTSSTRIDVECTDLEGIVIKCGTWAIIDFNDPPPPWFDVDLLGLQPGTKFGLLVSTGRDNTSVLNGLSLGETFAIEVFEDGLVSSLAGVEAPRNKKDDPGEVATTTELAVCKVEKQPERDDDAEAEINFLGPIKHGYRGTIEAGALVPDLTAVSIFHDLTGAGEVKLHIRFRSTGEDDLPETLNFNLRYAFEADGTCEEVSRSGPAFSEGIDAVALCRPNDDGTTTVTWEVTGIPVTLQPEFQLIASADFVPDDPRDDDDRGAVVTRPDTPCNLDQSNDDRWFVGG